MYIILFLLRYAFIISISMMKVPRSEKLHILPKVTQEATLALPDHKASLSTISPNQHPLIPLFLRFYPGHSRDSKSLSVIGRVKNTPQAKEGKGKLLPYAAGKVEWRCGGSSNMTSALIQKAPPPRPSTCAVWTASKCLHLSGPQVLTCWKEIPSYFSS